jgi:very-short-patch-repair endonuclease
MYLSGAAARLSRDQYGLVHRKQLLALGYSESAVKTGLRKGEFVWQLPGVLRATCVPRCWEQRPMGVVLWGGDLTAASHLTSAIIHGLVPLRTGPLEVSSDHRLRKRAGIVSFQNRLDRAEVVTVRFIPCTTVARTLVDLSHTNPGTAEIALDAALRMGSVSLQALNEYVELAAARKVRGSAAFRRLLSVRGEDEALSESEMESLYGRVTRMGSIPMGERQAPREGVRKGRVDIWYPEQNLVVELDGRKWHSSRRELKRDRRYDNLLNVSGKRVLRLNWEDLTLERDHTLDLLRRALGLRPLF